MKIAVLPGDGIGPEIMREAVKMLKGLGESFEFEEAPLGGAGYEASGHPLPDATLALAQKADAVMVGATGVWKYDKLEPALRPEQGILSLRTLAVHDSQSTDLPRLEPTGERELDRLVHALNATGARLADERRRASASERLAAIGRVAAGLAHEIRNPIAAMRLKTENALAVNDQERRVSAMHFILQQIERLDGLLRDLLAMTQRRVVKHAENDLAAFLG